MAHRVHLDSCHPTKKVSLLTLLFALSCKRPVLTDANSSLVPRPPRPALVAFSTASDVQQLGVQAWEQGYYWFMMGAGPGNKATTGSCWGRGLGTRLLLIHDGGRGLGTRLLLVHAGGGAWEQGYY